MSGDLHSRSGSVDPLDAATAEMMDELETAPAFLPSAFWRDINTKNVAMIRAEGVENFKRTVSQNYYNWLVVGRRDPQFMQVLKDWLLRPSLRPLLTRMEHDVSLRLTNSDEPIVVDKRQALIYRLFVGLLWERMRRADTERLADKVSEPEVGNPIRVWQSGRLITQDLANSIIECNVVAGLIRGCNDKPRVAEIGAGSGRLAHVFAATMKGTYYIFDIPPALYVSQWYLTRALPEKRMFTFRRFSDFSSVREEMESADVVFLTANQITHFPPGYFDVILSISTLPEMRLDQVSMYLDLFQRLSRGHIFLKQWKSWRNDLDGTDIRVDDYFLSADWQLGLDQTDPINPSFFNRVWRRR
jgi:putative sugar O-methyltransferase